MNIYFNISPRQSGKTDKAIYEYLKDKDNTIFVTHNMHMVQHLLDLTGEPRRNFVSTNSFELRIIGKRPKNIILDEYLFYKNKDKIYNLCHMVAPENIYVFTSANKTYSRVLFELVKDNKQYMSFNSLLDLFNRTHVCDYMNDARLELYDLYYNFITDKNVKIFDGKNQTNSMWLNRRDEIKNHISEKQFKLEYLNEWLEKPENSYTKKYFTYICGNDVS